MFNLDYPYVIVVAVASCMKILKDFRDAFTQKISAWMIVKCSNIDSFSSRCHR
jgi:hypothetical protein